MTMKSEESVSLTQDAETDILNGDFVLAEFLHEMDELEQLQALVPSLDAGSPLTNAEPMVTPTTPPEPSKRRSTSWLRRKQELQALRNESEALEARLVSLQMCCAQNSSQQTISPPTEELEMWKSVAAIARQETQMAQDENERLKHELLARGRVFEMLQAQLVVAESRKQQLLDSAMAFTNGLRIGMFTSRRLCCDNGDVFDILEKRINTRLDEFCAIVHDTRRSMHECNAEKVKVCRQDEHDEATVEIKHTRLLPFGEDATAKYVWQYIEAGGKADIRVARSSPDMLGLVTHHKLSLGNMVGVSVDVHTVIKRFAVAAGMVALVE
ncbi:unnamed protein product [Phytophthora fragariaefolia]|uniref:Unnamed protein product n=1 Tax=Phytophthora fragariaefolia TaxID=1490495 RepID=A0A9W6XR24_9STRA|nr:unnamed protein product [Phytophthora fragariaefolia]